MKNELLQIISQSRSLVFFGGAGVSTESGIPDFRSVDGLYNQKYDYPPEQMLSHTFFERKTEDFYRFYRDKILSYAVSAKPNAAHRKLAELEEKGVLSAVVTQNRRRGARMCSNCTAACSETTARGAAGASTLII